MREKKQPSQKDANKTPLQIPDFDPSVEEQPASPVSQISMLENRPELPNLANTLLIRQRIVMRMQRRFGNSAVARKLAPAVAKPSKPRLGAVPSILQRAEDDTEEESGGVTPQEAAVEAGAEAVTEAGAEEAVDAGAEAVTEAETEGETAAETAEETGAGTIQHATEDNYDVTGATLNDITGQLNHFDGLYAAKTQTNLGVSGRMQVQTLEDGSKRVDVPWAITSSVVNLPNWTDYGAACEAAQQEWDRFMRRARQHEQEAHIDMARQFVTALSPEDRVVTGATTAQLQQNLAAKQQELAGRLRSDHDACDHGVSIDAILHPDNGACE